MNDNERHYFQELHQQMPRQGPGNKACTLRALASISTEVQTILDLGCGPGQQTVHLATALPNATIDARDLWPAMVKEAEANVSAHGLQQRIDVQEGDMSAPPAKQYDLIWSEGAAYNIGVESALTTWMQHLTQTGHIALTDAVWLTADPPQELVDFWKAYPDMTNVQTRIRQAQALGLSLVTQFVLPEDAWLIDYYGPLQKRIDTFRAQAAGNPELTAVLDYSQLEIDLYRKYSDSYGYAFFVWKKA